MRAPPTPQKDGPRANRDIRGVREVQLIDDTGQNRGVVPFIEAMRIAEDAGLDLVEIAQIVEDEFGVELAGDDVKDLKTVGDVIDLVVAKAA